jgi:hypothetical protein
MRSSLTGTFSTISVAATVGRDIGNSSLLPIPLLKGQRLPSSCSLPVGGSWKSSCHASLYHGQKSLGIYATVSICETRGYVATARVARQLRMTERLVYRYQQSTALTDARFAREFLHQRKHILELLGPSEEGQHDVIKSRAPIVREVTQDVF